MSCVCLIYLTSCNDNNTEKSTRDTTLNNNDLGQFYRDPIIQKIFVAGKQNRSPILEEYLTDEFPERRKMASEFLSYIPDNEVFDDMVALLSDDDASVRNNAAYALGGIHTNESLDVLIQNFKTESDLEVKATILESIGKHNQTDATHFLTLIKTDYDDFYLRLGLLKAILAQQKQGIDNEIFNGKLLEFISSENTEQIRYLSSVFWSKSDSLSVLKYSKVLIENIKIEGYVQTSVNLIKILRFLKKKDAENCIKSLLKSRTDYRLRLAILSIIHHFSEDFIEQIFTEFVVDPNDKVKFSVLTNDHFFKFKILKNKCTQLLTETGDTISRIICYAILINEPNSSNELKKIISNSRNYFYQNLAYFALLQSKTNISSVLPLVLEMKSLNNQNFIFQQILESRNLPFQLKAELIEKIMTGENRNLQWVSSQFLEKQGTKLIDYYPNTYFFTQVLKNVNPKSDPWFYNQLVAGIRTLTGEDLKLENIIHDTINWQKINSLELNPVYEFFTSKGKFKIQLNSKSCPLAALAFKDLIDRNLLVGRNFFNYQFSELISLPVANSNSMHYSLLYLEKSKQDFNEGDIVFLPYQNTEFVQNLPYVCLSNSTDSRMNCSVAAKIISGMEIVHLLLPTDTIISVHFVK